ncbi:MAG: (2Fe-2S) ferredoxin domain-containing protein [Armatimonadetes bacterium]|nr:(2Fe-2S) ferredoxin domain-containing protein [Armatimonadota bacterium]
MLKVKVCVGSSCHIKGGARTLKELKALIEAYGLSDKVSLSADLCFEGCPQAPNVMVDDTLFGGVTPDRVEKFFLENILPRLDADGNARDNKYE